MSKDMSNIYILQNSNLVHNSQRMSKDMFNI